MLVSGCWSRQNNDWFAILIDANHIGDDVFDIPMNVMHTPQQIVVIRSAWWVLAQTRAAKGELLLIDIHRVNLS